VRAPIFIRHVPVTVRREALVGTTGVHVRPAPVSGQSDETAEERETRSELSGLRGLAYSPAFYAIPNEFRANAHARLGVLFVKETRTRNISKRLAIIRDRPRAALTLPRAVDGS